MSRPADATRPSAIASLDFLVALGRGLAGASPGRAPAVVADAMVPALADLAIVTLPDTGRPRLAAVRHRDLPADVVAGRASALLPISADGHGDGDGHGGAVSGDGGLPEAVVEAWREGLRSAFGAADTLLLPLDGGGPPGLLVLARTDGAAGFDPVAREAARAAAAELAAALAVSAPDPESALTTDDLPDLAWIADADGSPRWANRHAIRYAGPSCGASGWRPEIHPEDRPAAERDWQQALAAGVPFTGERRLRMADGSWRWHLVRAEPVRGADGRIARWTGLEPDIHERRVSEDAHAAATARSDFLAALRDRLDQVTDPEQTFPVVAAELTALFDATLVNLNEIGPDGTVAVRASGEGSFLPAGTYPLEQVYRPAVQALMAAGEVVAVGDVLRHPLTEGVGETFAANGVAAVLGVPVLRDGRWVGALVVGVPTPRDWRDDEIRLVRAVAERVWAARERAGLVRDLEATAARLRESREEAHRQLAELEAIYATAPVGLATLDRDLRFVRINERLAEINGLPAADHLGRTVREIVPLLADAAEPLMRRVLETGVPAEEIEITGETAAAPGVERAWVEHWSPIGGDGGETIGLNIVAEEITDRKRAEDDRIAFTRVVVHDVRNPLTVIQGAAQLLQLQARGERADQAEIEESMDSVIAAVGRALGVLEELLDAAHLRAGRPVELHREPGDLAELAAEVAASAQAGAPRHEIVVEADPGAGAGWWDRRRMERVIANLLENAVKYSPDGGRVSVRVAREDGPDGPLAVLAVSDEGIGIPAEDLPHLFEPFRRGGNVDAQTGGHGIGLSGVKQIVDLHGGAISVESREGRGSAFTIRLPVGAVSGR